LISGLKVKELHVRLDALGYTIQLWESGGFPSAHLGTSVRRLHRGEVEAWVRRVSASERIVCLEGMIKLVLCDRRPDSPTRDRVEELFLGQYRFREVVVPPGVLRGWKAVGEREALVLLTLEGETEEAELLGEEEAAVPYDWEIRMH